MNDKLRLGLRFDRADFRRHDEAQEPIVITDEMVERAARALCIEDGGDPDRTPRGHPAPVWQAFEDGARAALTAALLPEVRR